MSCTKFVFSGGLEKQECHSGLWLAETFSTSPLKLLNGIQRNLTGIKILTSSTKFVFFRVIGKTRWRPQPLIGWDIFDFPSETLKRNSTKPDRKQDLNVLYQDFFFSNDQKKSLPPRPPIGWYIFDFPSETAERNSTILGRRQDLNVLYQVFSAPEPKAQVHYCDHALSAVRRPSLTFHIFDFSSETAEWNSTKLDRKQYLNVLYQVCVFFFGRSGKQDGCPGLWLAETFSTSPLKPLNGIQRNLTGSKISTSPTRFVFFGMIRKTRWPPWPLIGWDIFDFYSETAERNSMKLDRKEDLNVLCQVCVFGPIGKTRWLPWPLIGWDIFDFWNRWTEFNETWQEARSQRPLRSLCF